VNLRDLRYLVAVADHRHFGQAADACFVSQPTLSTQIKKLERELGVELLERNPGQVLLTAAGERVVERARVVLQEAANIAEIAKRAQDPEAGTLSIGLFPTLAPYLLPHVVPRARERFPRLEMLLVEEKTEEILRRLRDGRLDVGILAQPIHDDRLRCEPLFEEDFLLAVPRGHRLASLEEATSESIAGESLLLLEEGHCLRDQALAVCAMSGASERSGFKATSLETLRQMVSAGVGITLLPELAVQPPVPTSEDIQLIRFAEPVPRRRIAMYWRPTSPYDEFMPQLAQLFRDLPTGLVHAIGPEPALG
jgi:LysR family hydrogen peroxide-inducible transcriptional activator